MCWDCGVWYLRMLPVLAMTSKVGVCWAHPSLSQPLLDAAQPISHNRRCSWWYTIYHSPTPLLLAGIYRSSI